MTSGNVSEEPQVIDDDAARARLGEIATYALMHDREIANRVDDSVARVMAGRTRILRRARGFAPAPIALPPGFEAAPELLAMGGELKATFCLVKDGEAILSQHQGDLENVETFDDYRKNLALYTELFHHAPRALVADRHPEYLSAKLAREWARAQSLPLIEAQHHHAHVAACLAENNIPLDAPPALGIVLDGLGWGDDGTVWGGEFLLADYRRFERLGAFKPVAMPGGAQAVREPWRNLYAHLMAEMGWAEFSMNFAELDALCRSFAPAARDARRNGPRRRQFAEGLFLRKAVRRRRRGVEHLPRAPGLRGRGGRASGGDRRPQRHGPRRRGIRLSVRHPQSARHRPALLSSRWRCGGRCLAISS